MSHSKTHHSEAEASVHYPMEPDPVYPELGPAEAAGPAYSGGTSSLFDRAFELFSTYSFNKMNHFCRF